MKIVPCCPPYNPHLETQIRSPTIFDRIAQDCSHPHCYLAQNVLCLFCFPALARSITMTAACAFFPQRAAKRFRAQHSRRVTCWLARGTRCVRHCSAAFVHRKLHANVQCPAITPDIHISGMVGYLHNWISAARGMAFIGVYGETACPDASPGTGCPCGHLIGMGQVNSISTSPSPSIWPCTMPAWPIRCAPT